MKKSLKIFHDNSNKHVCKRCTCGKKEKMETEKLIEKWGRTGFLDKLDNIDQKAFISQLLESQAAYMLRIDENAFNKTGFEQTLIHTIFPAVRRIGEAIFKLAQDNNKIIKAMDLPSITYNGVPCLANTECTAVRAKPEIGFLALDAEIEITNNIVENMIKHYTKLIVEENKTIFPYVLLIHTKLKDDEFAFMTRYGVIKQ